MFCCLHIKYVSYIYTQKLWFTHVSLSDKTIRVGVWTCGQRVPTRTPLPQPHQHTHLPTSRLEWSSRTMSHLEGNPSAASSSVVAISAANSCSVEADGSGDDNDTHVCVIYLTPIPGFPPFSTLWIMVLGHSMHRSLRSQGRLDFAPCRHADTTCLLYTSPSPRDRTRSRMPSSA